MTKDQKQALARALYPITSRVRSDVTAVKDKKGIQSWTNEPLTEERMMRHVNGVGPARGCCPIKEGESVTMVGLFDIDSHKGEITWPDMAACAARISAAAAMMGLEAIPFRSSGGNGIHLIFLWDEPQDAYSVRQCLKAILLSVGLKDGAGGLIKDEVEAFPRQDNVRPGGKGNQFILPLAGLSEPLSPILDYEPMGKDAVLMLDWPSSDPVSVVTRPVRAAVASGESVDIVTLRSALAAIPNEDDLERDYDQWRNILFALHAATGGSDDGLALAHEFSARSSKYDPEFLDNRTWPYITDKDGGISGRTVLAMAREHGWKEDISALFEVIPNEIGEDGVAVGGEVLPAFQRNKMGEIVATLDNTVQGVQSFAMTGFRVAWDAFIGALVITDTHDGSSGWRAFDDADGVNLRITLEQQDFKPISREMMRDVLKKVARDNQFDSAILWARQLIWDGKPRVMRFFADYFGATDDEYARAVSLYTWTAMAGRCLVPGTKADIAPVLIGGQGIKKSTGIAAMSPFDEWFAELDLGAKDDEKARILRGKLIAEFGEMRGMYSREIEHIKAFMSRQFEEWVPKFIEYANRYYRRAMFIGSSNQGEFLTDETGNRRWAPINVSVVDLEAIKRDREQLWAEAIVLFEQSGVMWQDVEALAKEKHSEHMVHDEWEHIVENWLSQDDDGVVRNTRALQLSEVISGALGIFVANIGRREELRVGKVMKKLGWEKRVTRIGAKLMRMWHKNVTQVTHV